MTDVKCNNVGCQGVVGDVDSYIKITTTKSYSDAYVGVNFNDAMIVLSDFISDWDMLTVSQKNNLREKVREILRLSHEDELLSDENTLN